MEDNKIAENQSVEKMAEDAHHHHHHHGQHCSCGQDKCHGGSHGHCHCHGGIARIILKIIIIFALLSIGAAFGAHFSHSRLEGRGGFGRGRMMYPQGQVQLEEGQVQVQRVNQGVYIPADSQGGNNGQPDQITPANQTYPAGSATSTGIRH
jgi:hypothetical protein